MGLMSNQIRIYGVLMTWLWETLPLSLHCYTDSARISGGDIKTWGAPCKPSQLPGEHPGIISPPRTRLPWILARAHACGQPAGRRETERTSHRGDRGSVSGQRGIAITVARRGPDVSRSRRKKDSDSDRDSGSGFLRETVYPPRQLPGWRPACVAEATRGLTQW